MLAHVGSVSEPDARLRDADLVACLELYVYLIINNQLFNYSTSHSTVHTFIFH